MVLQKVPQISRSSIEALVLQMDLDKDGKISRADLRQFCEGQHLLLSDQELDLIFADGIKDRVLINETQRQLPLSAREIWQTCQVHPRKKGQQWEQVERPSRKYWIRLLESVGER